MQLVSICFFIDTLQFFIIQNYCHETDFRRSGKPSGLVSSIIHEIQENAEITQFNYYVKDANSQVYKMIWSDFTLAESATPPS